MFTRVGEIRSCLVSHSDDDDSDVVDDQDSSKVARCLLVALWCLIRMDILSKLTSKFTGAGMRTLFYAVLANIYLSAGSSKIANISDRQGQIPPEHLERFGWRFIHSGEILGFFTRIYVGMRYTAIRLIKTQCCSMKFVYNFDGTYILIWIF